MIKSLLHRDYIYLRNVLSLTFLISIGLASIVGYFNLGPILVIFMVGWISLSGLATLNHNDVLSGMERRQRIIPVTTQAIVYSRYIFVFILIVFSFLYSLFLFLFFEWLFQQEISKYWEGLLVSLAWVFFFLVIITGIALFIYYRFGYRWIKYFYFTLCAFLFIFVPTLTNNSLTAKTFNTFLTKLFKILTWLYEQPLLFILCPLLIYILCATLSIWGYRKRVSNL